MIKSDLLNAGRGVLMGGADIIPGVSGGTVALILGIYERLVNAVSHFDLKFLQLIGQRRIAEAANHIDLRFLVSLGCGILCGIVGLANVMDRLLRSSYARPLTFAAFFGLILASSLLVARLVQAKTARNRVEAAALALGAGVFAFWLTGLHGASAQEGHVYAFFCGAIAICAMILPGISGSFVLLILGMYVTVMGVIRRLAERQVTTDDVTLLAVFAAGCATGLILFSKVLRWLLAKYQPQTMSVLCGFMIGSLRKVWPFKVDSTLQHAKALGLPEKEVARLEANPALLEELPIKKRAFDNIWPSDWDGYSLLIVAIAIAGIALVLIVDRLVEPD